MKCPECGSNEVMKRTKINGSKIPMPEYYCLVCNRIFTKKYNDMKILNQIYAVLNGNKTIICAIALLILDKNLLPISQGWVDVLNYALYAIGGGSLIDHVRKGYLSPKKGK